MKDKIRIIKKIVPYTFLVFFHPRGKDNEKDAKKFTKRYDWSSGQVDGYDD